MSLAFVINSSGSILSITLHKHPKYLMKIFHPFNSVVILPFQTNILFIPILGLIPVNFHHHIRKNLWTFQKRKIQNLKVEKLQNQAKIQFSYQRKLRSNWKKNRRKRINSNNKRNKKLSPMS